MDRSLLQIEPTTRCNFTCGFCCGRRMRQGDLSFEQFEELLAQNPELRHIELQGEGEPLMHPRFFDMVAAARARGVEVSIITNGSHFTPETIERLLASGISTINVSIESADEVAFQEIRGGKLAKVKRGLAALTARKRELGATTPMVGFAVTVLRRTRDELAAILALYRELGLDGSISTQPLQPMEAYTSVYDDEMVAQLLRPEEVNAFHRAAAAMPEFRAIEARPRAPSFYERLYGAWSPATKACPWLERGGYVTIDGDVNACCFVKDTQHSFGRLGRDPAEVIAERRDAIRAELAAERIPPPCRGCKVAHQIAPRAPRAPRPAQKLRVVANRR